MDADDFRCSEAGRVITCEEGFLSFVPAKLPRLLNLSPDIVRSLSEADAILGELAGICRHLPSPRFLTETFLRREAVLSSRIEGTQAQLSDILQDELEEGDASRRPKDIRKVRNYVASLELGIELCASMPISLRMVLQLHGRLYEGVGGIGSGSGKFRQLQNWIGPTGCSGHDAAFVPPPVKEMNAALFDWERFLSEADRLPDLIVCAIMHQQFETIHPFVDGNGRVGRLLITLFLMQRKRTHRPLLYLSSFFEANQDEYYHLLQRVRTEGDWGSWLEFFLAGVIQVSEQTILTASSLLQLREQGMRDYRDKPKAVTLMEHLLINPFVTVPKAEAILDVTGPTARQLIKHMESRGFLEEMTGRDWKRQYIARPVWEILQGNGLDEGRMPSLLKRRRRKAAQSIATSLNASEVTLLQESSDISAKRANTVAPSKQRFLSIQSVLGQRYASPDASADQQNDMQAKWDALPAEQRKIFIISAQESFAAEGEVTPSESWLERRAYILWKDSTLNRELKEIAI